MSDNGYKRGKRLLFDAFIAAVLLGFDQFTKYLAIAHLKGNEPFVLIEGVLELQYLENRGSAFGMFQNQKTFILLTGIVFMAVILFFSLQASRIQEISYCAHSAFLHYCRRAGQYGGSRPL